MEPNSSVAAKVRMLAGEISPKDVVLNKSSTYAVVQSRKSSGESHEVMKAALTGEGETCEKCHRPEAVCTKMLQIRAADEPMTRFMHCRACNHQWTDN
jgi:DNA-directed RNA polymerase subunit M/transcription elongation factor TFIIS